MVERCSQDLRVEGKPYPRTCAVHGLSCPKPAVDDRIPIAATDGREVDYAAVARFIAEKVNFYVSHREAALSAKVEELERERDEARLLSGLGCDANGGGEHTLLKQGNYTFCHKCGSTIRTPTLRERARRSEARAEAAEAREAKLREALTGMVVVGEAYLPYDGPNGPCAKRLSEAKAALAMEDGR